MDVLAKAAGALADRAVEAARKLTNNGAAIDDHQVVVERVAYAATEARVIGELAAAPAQVAPHAERIHHHDELIPERFIHEMAKLGYFGLSIPEKYGGHELGNLAMILTTEELSRASLAAAGSLITRPEILAKALLAGGTEAQKQAWLPRLASGEIMAAISVTEPDVGSDVASVRCRAERTDAGWLVSSATARDGVSTCRWAGSRPGGSRPAVARRASRRRRSRRRRPMPRSGNSSGVPSASFS